MTDDASQGYDAIAGDFIAVRSSTGRSVVQAWAASLPRGASVIDLGAGFGEPITRTLVEGGLDVCAIDASARMVSAFRERFPDVPVACEPAEQSAFFGQTFDGAIAVGLVFLLPEDTQRTLIQRVAGVLKPGGRFLFSAPHQVCTWEDVLTKRPSRSLGLEAYRETLKAAGLTLANQHTDDGGTHYYEALKSPG